MEKNATKRANKEKGKRNKEVKIMIGWKIQYVKLF